MLIILSSCSSCFRYHKGTDFQANHKVILGVLMTSRVVLDTTKVQIFKQITTHSDTARAIFGCFRYHKGTDFQANHNTWLLLSVVLIVVLDTTKVQIFKQITTYRVLGGKFVGCFRYHKGTDFQANHN